MDRIVIFGASNTGKRIKSSLSPDCKCMYFVDNNKEKWNTKCLGVDVYSPEVLCERDDYDKIIIASMLGIDTIYKQLLDMNIPSVVIDRTYTTIILQARILFLKRYAELMNSKRIEGAVAECGVYKGDFAREINKYFSNRKCYLFDTFEGFPEEDISENERKALSDNIGFLKDTSVQKVIEVLPNPEKVVIKKGYFPDTAKGIEDKFVFVNLDMDLYKPTLDGLRFFWNRMVEGGCVLIHDYFTEIYPDIKVCVDEFEKESVGRIHKIPIGDDISIALIK